MWDWIFIIGAILVAVGLGAIKWFLAPIFIGVVMMTLAYYATQKEIAPDKPRT